MKWRYEIVKGTYRIPCGAGSQMRKHLFHLWCRITKEKCTFPTEVQITKEKLREAAWLMRRKIHEPVCLMQIRNQSHNKTKRYLITKHTIFIRVRKIIMLPMPPYGCSGAEEGPSDRDGIGKSGERFIMKMRYFRFLYGKTQGCFLHLGELNDTKRNEKFTFLYMQGMNELVNQNEVDHTLFLYPKCVDLLILGKADSGSVAAMKGLLENIQVGTAVIPEIPEEEEKLLVQSLKAERIVRLKKFGESFGYSAAGWMVSAKCWKDGALVMKHMPEEQDVSKGESSCFDDCVMSIKEINNGCRCRQDSCPDEYGCALGCIRGRDFDMCKSRLENQAMPYTVGTVLVAGDGSEEEKKLLMESMKNETLGTRFFVSVDSEECVWFNSLHEAGCGKTDSRRYFIGTKLSDSGVGRICRSGLGNVPVVLSEEDGICCSGFMKYCEEK